jgi:hypothetical protein
VCGLALPLLVARVLANHAQDIFTLYDAAAFAKAFYGCSYFHFCGWKSFGVGFRGQKIALKNAGLFSATAFCRLLLAEGDTPFG